MNEIEATRKLYIEQFKSLSEEERVGEFRKLTKDLLANDSSPVLLATAAWRSLSSFMEKKIQEATEEVRRGA